MLALFFLFSKFNVKIQGIEKRKKRTMSETVDLSLLEEKLEYTFNNKALLIQALTHSTFAYEVEDNSIEDNERLEFLGDSILSAVISKILFDFGNLSEGKMTKTRSLVVRRETLAQMAHKLLLPQFMRLGQGEEKTGGRKKHSNAEDCMEALIGAIYLDSNFDEVSTFITKHFSKIVAQALEGQVIYDYKSQVFELLQRYEDKPQVDFVVLETSGPPHDRRFTVALKYKEVLYPSYKAKSKRIAEQGASQLFLETYTNSTNLEGRG